GSVWRPQESRETTGGSQRGFKKLFSWKHGAGSKDAYKSEPDEVFWPLDLLPEDCANSRILTWGYDSEVSHFFGGATNQSNISAHARNLLYGIRRLKIVLRRAAADTDPSLLDIYTSTKAVAFLGTPHRGSSKAGIAEVVRKIVSASGFDTTDQNIRALQVNSSELELIHELFMKLYDQQDRHFKVFTFQEAKGVIGISYLGLNERVVEPFSSSITTTEPTQTINANHMSMCRFPNRDDEGYKQVSGEIQIVISDIQRRREQDVLEKDKQLTSLRTESPSQTTTSSAAYSLNDVERKCVALLTQNTANAAEYRFSLPHRVEGTCQWILSISQYVDWTLQEETCLLWISGYPGTGKTILSAYLLEHLGADETTPDLRTTLCYFFCDEKIDTQRDGTAIVRSLIHQIVMRRRVLIKYVKSAYDVHGPQFDQNFIELWRIFIAIASDKRVGPVSVIVDAIDECEETTRERFLRNVLQITEKARPAGGNTPCIKFVITSRPLLGRQYTTNLLQIDPSQNYIEQDLKLVIRMKVEGIVRRTRCKADVKVYLENALNSKADRTFLWVTLVLHLLERSFLASQRDFKRIIDELPRTLKTTYKSFLRGIATEYQPLATTLLHFFVGSLRPLTLEEIRILIAMQDHHRNLVEIEGDAQPNIQETIEGVLGPLVRIWDSKVYLIHQSLKEFLQNLSAETEDPLSAIYGIDPCKANLVLAKACVSYLLLDDFEQDIFSRDQSSVKDSPTSPLAVPTDEKSFERLWDPFDIGEDTLFKDSAVLESEACISIASQYAFFDYSTKHWAEHFSSASSASSRILKESVLLLSDVSSPRGLNWFRYFWLHTETDLSRPQNFDPFMTASYFGHLTSLEILLQKDNPIEPDIGTRGIFWASRMGHHGVVDLLLREDFNPDLKVVDGQSALIAAVQFNRLAVVMCLLKDDGLISKEEGYRVNHTGMGGRTPLSIAAGNGYIEIVEQVLQHNRVRPDIADFDEWTPLFWSVSGKHWDVIRLLLEDNRISVNHVDRSGRNVLSLAASSGELELVKHLLSLKDLRADEPDRNGRTALSWAAGNGHQETTKYLRRSQRIDVCSKDKDGRNALSWACSGGHHRVVEYLIKHDGQGVDQEDVDGWTPLAWALFREAPKTVQVLLDSGLVDVNRKDSIGRSALSFAAGYGYLDIVRILLKADGIDANSEDNDGRTPLSDDTSVAILERHDGIHDHASSGVSHPSATIHFHERITADNSQYGGIHPLTALDSHQTNLGILIAKSLLSLPGVPHDALSSTPTIPVGSWAVQKRKPDFISVTRGPGMRSSLSTGLDTAKGLAIAWQIPLLGVNHMQAHALTPRLVSAISPSQAGTIYKPSPEFPFLSLLLSGGHTLLLHSTSLLQHLLLATTTDIALGDCIDKTARAVLPPAVIASNGPSTSYGRLLELFTFPNGDSDYSYSPPLTRAESLTRSPTPYRWSLGSPLAETRGGRGSTSMQYSFSGLESAVQRIAGADPEMGIEERKCLAREAMRVAFEHVAERVVMALQTLGTPKREDESTGEDRPERRTQPEVLVVSGGVAANGYLKAVLRAFLTARGFPHVRLAFPPPALCTDNAAMIAWAGMEMWSAGWESSLSVRALRKWGLDEKGADGGVLGVGGWRRRDGL
ncbi:hypothetical protein MMC11_006799, partial [Xylographa trunciseda]|nr:hypothetical protein [Xylographa trunciseda]